MNERDEFFDAQNHSAAPGSSQKKVCLMVRAAVAGAVPQGDEFVRDWIGQHTQRAREPARDRKRTIMSASPDPDSKHRREERSCNFGLGQCRNFWRVDKKRRTTIIEDGTEGFPSPRMMSTLEKHLEDTSFSVAEIGQTADDARKWIHVESANESERNHELMRQTDICQDDAAPFCRCPEFGERVGLTGNENVGEVCLERLSDARFVPLPAGEKQANAFRVAHQLERNWSGSLRYGKEKLFG
jgi:hypothetical protein